MTPRIRSALIACAAASICAMIRPAGCALDEVLCETVPDSRSQAAMPPAATRTHAIRLIDDMEAQPFGDERRLAFILDLDRHVEPHDDVPWPALANFAELGDGTNARADFDGRRKPHLLESVIHEELAVREHRDERQAQMHEQRQRQKAVCDRAAERRRLRTLDIDVDELVVERDVGESVHARLIDEEPVRGAELAADHGSELL